ncbi:MAG: hypothetical protein ACTSUF_03700 [Candidatus Heimdallarchaeaceae archaeon]
MNWTEKLIQLGIPQDLAIRMTPDVETLPYRPEQFTSLQQLVPVMQSYGFASLDWWEDLQNILAQIIAIIPGFILVGVGGAMAYFLKNIKIGKIPLALIGIIPIGIGTWMILQPFLTPQQGG